MTSERKWFPTRFLGHHDVSYSVIVLNVAIQNLKNFLHVCSSARNVIAADGGANRIFDLQLSGKDLEATIPRAIVGDLDSLRPDVREFYEAKGVSVEHDPDQYSTDFTKSLKYIKKNDFETQSVIVFGGLGGRLDQAFAQLHQLYMAAQNPSLAFDNLFLSSDEGMLFLLEKGTNIIDTSAWPDLITENVGIIPLGKSAIISTRGLEWDVADWDTSFDTQVSTSNHIRDSKVVITATERVFFTLEFAKTES